MYDDNNYDDKKFSKSKGRDAIHHLGFQAPNPMTQTAFERELLLEDVKWQEDIRHRQVEGMQGFFGGRFPNQQS